MACVVEINDVILSMDSVIENYYFNFSLAV